MLVVIAGAGGLIGTALCRSYQQDGHRVRRLPRQQPGALIPELLDGADVVINLAGANIGGRRWTPKYRRLILRSRIDTTATIAVSAALASRPPKMMLSASGIRYYGTDRGETVLTESSPGNADGFLPSVAHAWEAATEPAASAGIPVCRLRLGIVLSRHGGALPRMLPVFRAGLGARLGSGRQFWSYVSLTDAVRAIRLLGDLPGAHGPYNITAPTPVRNAVFARALADAMGRPAALWVPGAVLRLVMGGVAGDALDSLRVFPSRLAEVGFRHQHPDIESALADALA